MTPIFTPSEFVALANQAFEQAFPVVEIEGEVLNFKISKNRWVYFDIADESSKLRSFGTVYILPAPVEDGMMVRIVAAPRLHPQFGFSLNIQSLQFSGEGNIKKASDLLRLKLEKEGLFLEERKRSTPYPPQKIALVTSSESAAYKDFTKILAARYGGIEIELANVAVQGEAAVGQVVGAIEWFNKQANIADVLVVIRGGGSADDLQAFSSEQVVRAVAASRIPTVVAIGHEVDISLAELAADLRASTPSNAAELLVPDRKNILAQLNLSIKNLTDSVEFMMQKYEEDLGVLIDELDVESKNFIKQAEDNNKQYLRTLNALSPQAVLKRGYSIVYSHSKVVRQALDLKVQDKISIKFSDGEVKAEVQ
ncbi:MAG: exodeoxyribonuclease VII large subunit [bacterium]|nr:exodeoxyribonuclease VII large subunit [bacterium]